MNERIEKLARELKKNKRTSDRLPLPVTVSYKLTGQENWFDPCNALDTGGRGLRFSNPRKLDQGTELDLRVWLPDAKQNPITTKAKVCWCEPLSPSLYSIGVQFEKMEKRDNDRYVSFFCNSILENYCPSKE